MGPPGSGPSHPTSSYFSTRTGRSFSQFFFHCVSSAIVSQIVVQNIRRSCCASALARTVQRRSFSTYVRTLRTKIQICRSAIGNFSGTKDCRMPGSYRKDPNNSLRQDRSLPTRNAGILRRAHSWPQWNTDPFSEGFHAECQFSRECVATSLEALAAHGPLRRGTGDDPTQPDWVFQFGSPFTHLCSITTDALQITGTLRSNNR